MLCEGPAAEGGGPNVMAGGGGAVEVEELVEVKNSEKGKCRRPYIYARRAAYRADHALAGRAAFWTPPLSSLHAYTRFGTRWTPAHHGLHSFIPHYGRRC